MLKRTLTGLMLLALTSLPAAGQTTQQVTQFLQAPQYPTGTNPQGVAIGDFNGDGVPDVAVVNNGSNSITILLGSSNGTLTPVNCSTACATDSSPQNIAVGYFVGANGQGPLGVAVTNSGSNTISVFLGNGDGTVQPKIDYATGNGPQGITVADFNGDGYPDIAITNATDGTIGIFLNNQNGTFGTKATTGTQANYTYNAAVNPWAIVAGNFRGKGIQDLAVVGYGQDDQLLLFEGNGNGTFAGGIPSATGLDPVALAVGYFNGPNNPLDIAVVNAGGNSVSILTGDGKGNFTTNQNATYPTATFPTSIVVADLNGDGIPDLAVSASQGNVLTVIWGHGEGGTGDGTFVGQVNCGTGNDPYAVAAADFSGTANGQNDLVVANWKGSSVSVIINNGNETFQSRLDYVAGPGGSNARSATVADFNGDGIPDLAFADEGGSEISVVLGNGDGSFQAPTTYSTGTATKPYFIVEGDFNLDGVPDVAVANYATSTVSVFLGQRGPNNTFTFPTRSDYPVGNPNLINPNAEPTSIAIGDFNGDGYPDLAVTNYNEESVTILLNAGTANPPLLPGAFVSAPTCDGSTQNACPVGNGPISVAAGKFTASGNMDLVVINETDNDATILMGNGDGTFTAQSQKPHVGGNPQSVAVADLNGDGILDLAVADLQTPQVSVLLGNGSGGIGNGTFQTANPYSTGTNASAVVIGDFNGDGIPDLALVSNTANEVSLLWGIGSSGKPTGTFTPPALFGAGYFSYSLAVGDFNMDGALDLAVANGGSNTVSILLNTQGTSLGFTSSSNSNPPIYGQSVTLTATVATSVPNGLAAPTGTVTFENGSAVIGTPQTLTGGAVSVSTSTLPAGTDPLAAVYSGDSNYQPHTVYLSQAVGMAGSSTTLTSSMPESAPNQMITFTATVASVQPTGTVTFLNGSTSLGSSALNGSGQATLSTSSLPMGTSNITAVYSGNSNVTGSNSSVWQQVVGKPSTSTALTANPDTGANLNQSVTFTATVAPSVSIGIAPTGTVTFLSGSTMLGTGTLNGSGVATYTTSTLAAGTDSISASYAGDSNFLASNSAAMGFVVTAPNFNLSAGGWSSSSIAPGSTSTASVTITAVGGLNPSTVQLTCAVTPTVTPAATCSLGSISVANGKGTATVTFSTTGATASLMPSDGGHGSRMLFALGLVVPAILLGGASRKSGRRKLMNFCLLLALAGCMFHVACGGGSSSTPPPSGNSGTPANTYTVKVSGAASGVTSSSVQLAPVTVQ